jgi:hypothetical protein
VVPPRSRSRFLGPTHPILVYTKFCTLPAVFQSLVCSLSVSIADTRRGRLFRRREGDKDITPTPLPTSDQHAHDLGRGYPTDSRGK